MKTYSLKGHEVVIDNKTLPLDNIIYEKVIEDENGGLLFGYLVAKSKESDGEVINRIWHTARSGYSVKLISYCYRSCIVSIFINDENVDEEFCNLVSHFSDMDESKDFFDSLRIYVEKCRKQEDVL